MKDSGPTRRTALGTMAGGVAGALAVSGSLQASGYNAGGLPKMIQMDCQQWQEFVGHKFMATDSKVGQVATLKLQEVVDDQWIAEKEESRPADVRPKAVSMIFSANREIEDAEYVVRHAELGEARLYVHATRRHGLEHLPVYQVVLN